MRSSAEKHDLPGLPGGARRHIPTPAAVDAIGSGDRKGLRVVQSSTPHPAEKASSTILDRLPPQLTGPSFDIDEEGVVQYADPESASHVLYDLKSANAVLRPGGGFIACGQGVANLQTPNDLRSRLLPQAFEHDAQAYTVEARNRSPSAGEFAPRIGACSRRVAWRCNSCAACAWCAGCISTRRAAM